MILWLILGLMTAAAIVAVLLPLARPGAKARSDNDIAVYRDQLDELERDLASLKQRVGHKSKEFAGLLERALEG